MQALPFRSFASLSARLSRLFSRCIHSASMSSPSRSSKESFWMSGFFCCSLQAAASTSSRMALSFSMVGSVSTSFLSVIVAAAADVLVRDGGGALCVRRLHRRGQPVEAVLQDGFDVAVGARPHGNGAGRGRLEPLLAEALAEPQDAEARAVALLRVAPLGEDRLDQLARLRADARAPVNDAR